MESSFLVIDPSAFRGAARTLDLWGQLDDYNISPSGAEADAMAAQADALALEEDFASALNGLETDDVEAV